MGTHWAPLPRAGGCFPEGTPELGSLPEVGRHVPRMGSAACPAGPLGVTHQTC